MTPTFVALRVSSGDAFYAEANDDAVMIDGGRKGDVVDRYKTQIGRMSGVTVLICTHADLDHSAGALAFLEAYKAKEVWLPVAMASFVLAAHAKGGDLHEALVETVERLWKYGGQQHHDDEGPSSLGHVIDLDALTEHHPIERGDAMFVEKHAELAERASDLVARLPEIHPLAVASSAHRKGVPLRFAVSVAGTAGVITRLVQLALSKSRVRWFEYGAPTPLPGAPMSLWPANCHETTAVTETDLTFAFALSVANQQSLVFGLGHGNRIVALFCADSSFDFPFPPSFWPAPMAELLATAPHHGSADPANVKVYDIVNAWTSSLCWVRSDFVGPASKTRPAKRYLDEPKRYCTECRTGVVASRQQNVVLGYSSWTDWTKMSATTSCACV